MSMMNCRKIAEPFSESDLIRFFNSVSETESKLRDATQPRYVLEIGLGKINRNAPRRADRKNSRTSCKARKRALER